MKINEYPKEIQDKCKFACLVCREKHKIITGINENCSCRAVLNEYCPILEKAIEEEMEK